MFSRKLLVSMFLVIALAIPCSLMAKERPAAADPKQPSIEVLKGQVTKMKSLLGQIGQSVAASPETSGRTAGPVDSARRQEQIKNVRAIRDGVVNLRSNLPRKTRRLAEPLRLELERLSFSVATGEDTQEIKRRLGNVDTLLGVIATRMSMACGACGGKGKDAWGTLCKICGGDGYVQTPPDPKPCAACNGKGKDTWGSLCAPCKGTGWAKSGTGHGTLSVCASCQGKGKDAWGTLCKICEGDGYVLTSADPKPCAACSGKGKDAWGTLCVACKGSGWAEYTGQPGGHGHHQHGDWYLKICGLCKGAGKDTWGTSCKPCGGDGYVAIQNDPHACAACNGNGKDTWGTICPACQGTGWANTTSNPTWGGPMGTTPCGTCQGKGKDTWGTMCKVCGGDGYISSPSDQKSCAACQGKGKDTWGTPCPACQGLGWARSVEPRPDLNR